MISNEVVAPDVPDVYKLFREEIRFEHSQINARMSWFLGSQTIFAAAYAAVATQKTLSGLLMQIALLGLLLSILISVNLWAGIKKISWIRAAREHKHIKDPNDTTGTKDSHYYVGSDLVEKAFGMSIHRCGLAFPFGAPIAFAVFWASLLIQGAVTHTAAKDDDMNVNVKFPAPVNINVNIPEPLRTGGTSTNSVAEPSRQAAAAP